MEFLLQWLLWFSINLAATISPGPAFAMTVRTAIAHDRRAGLFTALGLGAGIAVHMALVAFGLAVILSKSALVFSIVKYAGAAYLIFIGIKAIRAQKREIPAVSETIRHERAISRVKSFQTGLLTNVLNPKSILFFSAMATQFISPGTPVTIMLLYGATAIIIESGWFSIVTLVLTDAHVKNKFLSIAHWIERICGGLLIMLGLKLALTKAAP